MRNPVFNLVDKYINQLKVIKNISLELLTATNSMLFYKVTLNNPSNIKTVINNKECTVTEWHITIFEDLSKSEGLGETSHHVTINFDNQSTAHIYFDKYNKIVGVTFKADNQSYIADSFKVVLKKLGRNLSLDFTNALWQLYQTFYEEKNITYNQLVVSLTELSKQLDVSSNVEANKQVWDQYNHVLTELVSLIEEWSQCNLSDDIRPSFKYFRSLKASTEQRLSQLSILATEARQAREKLNSSIIATIENEIDALARNDDFPAEDKLLNEYDILAKYLTALNDAPEALRYISRMNEIENRATYLLTKLLLPGKEYEQTATHFLEHLIKIVPFISIKFCRLAVINSRIEALKLIIKHHSYINLNELLPNKITLLEEAYKLKLLDSFRLLLKAGVACDQQLADGDTLLIKACLDGRTNEMVALLDAGASNMTARKFGFTAFGVLIGNESVTPDLNTVQLFIKHCRDFMIDLMQGYDRQRGPALSFACQWKRGELVKLLLENGANPNVVRESDLNSSLAICAAKGFFNICKIILNNSKFSLEDSIYTAYYLSKEFKRTEISELLKKHAHEKKYDLSGNTRVYTLEIGSTLNPAHFATMISKKI